MDIAKLSNLVVTTLGEDEDIEDDTVEIPLPNVKATVLAKVIEYCTHYKQVEPSKLYCNIISKNLDCILSCQNLGEGLINLSNYSTTKKIQ